MDPQNRYPSDPGYPGYLGQSGGQSGQSGDNPHDEQTRVLPPYQPTPAPTHTQPYPVQGPLPGPAYAPQAPARRRRGLTAAALAGALVLGGAAGVGGAAAYDVWGGNGTNGSATSAGDYEATNAALVENGTVEKVADVVLPSVVKVNVTTESGAGSGSGIILSKDGEILTNNHVVAGAGDEADISVNFQDGTTKRATVIGTDPLTDVAVIKAEGVDDLTPASLGKSGAIKVGQAVVAVGSPFGLNATVTSGIVSALNRPVSVAAEESEPQDEQGQENPFGGEGQEAQPQQQSLSTTYPAIQTDAAINPGNSGGPLVDLSGRVIGINSSIRTAGGSETAAGGSIGLGFAIPIDEVLPIVNQIRDDEKPTHARLGVTASDVDAQGNTLTQGAQLQSVEGGGSADDAGLAKGDVITKVGDQVIDGSESLVATIRGHRPGDDVEITFVRDGETRTVTADLGSDENNTAS